MGCQQQPAEQPGRGGCTGAGLSPEREASVAPRGEPGMCHRFCPLPAQTRQQLQPGCPVCRKPWAASGLVPALMSSAEFIPLQKLPPNARDVPQRVRLVTHSPVALCKTAPQGEAGSWVCPGPGQTDPEGQSCTRTSLVGKGLSTPSRSSARGTAIPRSPKLQLGPSSALFTAGHPPALRCRSRWWSSVGTCGRGTRALRGHRAQGTLHHTTPLGLSLLLVKPSKD